MTNTLAVPTAGTLSIAPDQNRWTEKQVAALRHLGVDQATDADLEVFFHQCTRTGLDPFTRQIYMVGRWSREGTKYTIQTGIDGYRLIGRRAAAAARETISLDAPQWADANGAWHDVWSTQWGTPLAARITIYRNGQPFTAVALFDEYKQTKRDGGLTQMWSQRPAGQIAKCAESLAWRMAFPQDLSGIYTAEEMAQADNPVTTDSVGPSARQEAPRTTATRQGPSEVGNELAGTEQRRKLITDTAEAATTVEQLTEVWAKAHRFGVLDDDMQTYLRGLKAKLEAAAVLDDETEPVDAEIVEDQPLTGEARVKAEAAELVF